MFRAKSGKKLAELEGYRALFGAVYDGDQALDECVALNYRAPASYTGETRWSFPAMAAYICCGVYCRRFYPPVRALPVRVSLPAGLL